MNLRNIADRSGSHKHHEFCDMSVESTPIKVKRDRLPPLSLKENIVIGENLTERWYQIEKQKQSSVYIRFYSNKHAFLQYYENLVKVNSTASSYLLLGDAYMKIFDTEKALINYEKALTKSKHLVIISTLGEALVKFHYFDRAILFYQQHILETRNSNLKLKLAELYLNLKHYQKAELLLLELQEEETKDEDDESYFKTKLKTLLLLARTQESTENYCYAIKNLKNALEICKIILNGDTFETFINIVVKLGELAIILNQEEQAVSFYEEGLKFCSNSVEILLGLAQVYMLREDFTLCRETSLKVLKMSPHNHLAAVNLIDIEMKQGNFEKAALQCKEILFEDPSCWEVLMRLVNILRRTGDLDEVVLYLKTAKKFNKNIAEILYIQGLYHWYSGELSLAHETFKMVIEDPIIGVDALTNIIEMYLSIDSFLDSGEDTCGFSEEVFESIDDYMKILRIKLGPKYIKTYKYRLLQNKLLIWTKEKDNIEKALEDLKSSEFLSNNVGTVLVISIASMLLNQEKRARNNLKLIIKTKWTLENAEHLEDTWLLLGDLYIKSSRFVNASKLMYKVLQYNKSSCRAHRYLGYIFEKVQNFKNAVTHYTMAWKLGKKRNVSVGIKLASCLMKLKRYSDAIIIGNEVLEVYPGDDTVKVEILEKCIARLRC